jgi:hypothetical protein
MEVFMKLLKLTMALAMAASGLSVAASAEAHPDRHRYERRWDHRDYRDHRRYERRPDYRRYDRPRYRSAWRYRDNHRRCWTEWRHHQRVRICR